MHNRTIEVQLEWKQMKPNARWTKCSKMENEMEDRRQKTEDRCFWETHSSNIHDIRVVLMLPVIGSKLISN